MADYTGEIDTVTSKTVVGDKLVVVCADNTTKEYGLKDVELFKDIMVAKKARISQVAKDMDSSLAEVEADIAQIKGVK